MVFYVLTQKAIGFNNVGIVSVRRNDYRFHFGDMSKSNLFLSLYQR